MTMRRSSTQTPVVVLLAALLWFFVVPLAAAAPSTGSDKKAQLDPDLSGYLPTIGLAGKLHIVGSDSMQVLMTRLHTAFQKWNSKVIVSIETEGSDAGFQQFLEWCAPPEGGQGTSDQAMVLASSRQLSKDKLKAFADRVGYEPTETLAALDAVAIYLPESNPLPGLTMEQVDAVYSKTRKRGAKNDITTWGQLGLKKGWEQKTIHLYGRDGNSGTRSFFKHEALLGGDFKDAIQEESGSGTLILAVSNDPAGMAYSGIGFQFSSVRIVPLAEKPGMPFIRPGADTVLNGSYPLGRKLYLYFNKPPKGGVKPIEQAFAKLVNSRDGQEVVIDSGFFPLSQVQTLKNLQAVLASH
jgi:phosphate transport system substrate-binding protein